MGCCYDRGRDHDGSDDVPERRHVKQYKHVPKKQKREDDDQLCGSDIECDDPRQHHDFDPMLSASTINDDGLSNIDS